MSASFLTSLSEQEFKEFLKSAIKEIIGDDLAKLKSSLPDILNIKEAAAFLKLKITTLYEKTSQKIIPHFKKGNKLYFNRNELEEWIKTGKVKTKQEIEGNAVSYLLTKKNKNNRKNK
ncbi:MAG: helix-turn-helix domain-containing protein [Bacteroidetes bacterium]|nr:helix-turn-helix domain-containing protein [Bacteroidota bacterium]